MSNKKSSKKKKSNTQKMNIIQILLGIALIVLPNLFPATIMTLVGSLLIVSGAIMCYSIYKSDNNFISMLFPIVLIVLGFYSIYNPHGVITVVALVFGVVTVLKGILIIFSGTNKYYRIAGIVSVILGILIITFAGSAGAIFSYYIGITLIFHALIDLFIPKNNAPIITPDGYEVINTPSDNKPE